MEPEKLFTERLNRIKDAVALKKPDRVPVVLEYAGFAPHVTKTSMAGFLKDPELNLATMMQTYDLCGQADAMNYGSFWPYGLGTLFFSKVLVPGVDLPDNELWQVHESPLMTREDYDVILNKGWPAFSEGFMKEKVWKGAPEDFFPPKYEFPDAYNAWKQKGVPVLAGGDVTTPFEVFCGARSLMEFIRDMAEIPDKVQAAMDAVVPHLAQQAVVSAKKRDYPLAWVGGWRTAPAMLSPVMWNRFAWPYIVRLVNEVVEQGVIALLHLDANWNREVERFKELPAKRCIFATDGATDLYAAKKALDGHMCLMGDVPATMFFMETPEAVYDYCTKLIKDLGPEGFILQSGCDIPANAKLENVKAMVAAALES